MATIDGAGRSEDRSGGHEQTASASCRPFVASPSRWGENIMDEQRTDERTWETPNGQWRTWIIEGKGEQTPVEDMNPDPEKTLVLLGPDGNEHPIVFNRPFLTGEVLRGEVEKILGDPAVAADIVRDHGLDKPENFGGVPASPDS
jgi:hypothetical protein